MKRFKKWSFVILLAITGIVYCGIDRDLLEITRWESLVPMVEGSPEDDWNLQQEESVSASGMEGDIRNGEADQTGVPDTGAQGEEPGQAQPDDPENMASQSQDLTVSGEPEGEEVPPEPEPEVVIGRVEEDYFVDALFLGDSRTVGLGQYGSLKDIATFYASTGMTIYKLLGAEIVEMPEQQKKITVEEALQHLNFRKIYIMMGINEVGGGTAESFAKAYGEVIARIQELQPDAIIYIEGILKVTKARSDKGDYINNEAIEARNEAISQLADGEKIFYLDVNQAVCDEDGGLVKDYTSDGVHLKAKYITLWEEYLKDNAVLLDGTSGESTDPAVPVDSAPTDPAVPVDSAPTDPAVPVESAPIDPAVPVDPAPIDPAVSANPDPMDPADSAPMAPAEPAAPMENGEQ